MKKPKPFPELATKRLRLRRFRPDDVDGLHACFGDSEAMRYWDFPPSKSSTETARWVKALGDPKSPHTWLGWALARKGSDRCIGMVNYHHRETRNRRLEIGYILIPSLQGKGFMTEALQAILTYCFMDLNVHRVEAIIDPGNAASIRLATRLGFRLEGGPLRDYWRVGETYRSTMMYGLLAGELIPAASARRGVR
jgi:[ribosomal protein S5]-alanine N-acetyltransferase